MIKIIFGLAILACVGVQVYSYRRNWRPRTITTTRAPVCKTVDGQKCQFPFIYKGKTYNQCTYDDTQNGQPWCAYETKWNNITVPNKWEDCNTSVCETCKTESGPDPGSPCKFPFKYNGVTFNSCTLEYTWSGQDVVKSWCSTETFSNGTHVKGKFGFCGSSCPGFIPTYTTTTQTTRNTEKECYTLTNAKCVFPFRYLGQTYNSCTKSTGQDYEKYWCSTNTDSYGNHQKGNCGFCGTGNGCF